MPLEPQQSDIDIISECIRSHTFLLNVHVVDALSLGYLDMLRVEGPPRDAATATASLLDRSAEVLEGEGTASLQACGELFREAFRFVSDASETARSEDERAMEVGSSGRVWKRVLALTSPSAWNEICSSDEERTEIAERYPLLHRFSDTYWRLGSGLRFRSTDDESSGAALGAEVAAAMKATGAMKAKKHLEVSKMAPLIDKIARELGVETVVDVGAGQGHLAATLARLGHDVVALERDGHQAHGAMLSVEKLMGTGVKKPSKDKSEDPSSQHGSLRVCHASLEASTTTAAIETALRKRKDGGDAGELSSLGLVSLHACGSLSHNMLRIFAQWPEKCRFIVNVGCCYNLIGTQEPLVKSTQSAVLAEGVGRSEESPTSSGHEHPAILDEFPMSAAVRRSLPNGLQRNAKMAACQAPLQWATDEAAAVKTLQTFGQLHQRAVVQLALKTLCGIDDVAKIGRVSAGPPTFPTSPPEAVAAEVGAKRPRGPGPMGMHEIDWSAASDEGALKSFVDYVHGVCSTVAARQAEPVAPPSVDDVAGFAQGGMGSPHLNGRPERECVELAVLWSLRAMLGHLAETLILMDRAAFLEEESSGSIDVRLVPAWPHEHSARHVAVVAMRK